MKNIYKYTQRFVYKTKTKQIVRAYPKIISQEMIGFVHAHLMKSLIISLNFFSFSLFRPIIYLRIIAFFSVCLAVKLIKMYSTSILFLISLIYLFNLNSFFFLSTWFFYTSPFLPIGNTIDKKKLQFLHIK